MLGAIALTKTRLRWHLLRAPNPQYRRLSSSSSLGELNASINWPWETRWRGHHLRKESFLFDSALQKEEDLRREKRRRKRDRALVKAVAEGRDLDELMQTFLWHNSRGRSKNRNPDPLPWGFCTPAALRAVEDHRRERCP